MYISVRYAPARRVAKRARKSATPQPRAAASPRKIPDLKNNPNCHLRTIPAAQTRVKKIAVPQIAVTQLRRT
jgi:hypothetical protein